MMMRHEPNHVKYKAARRWRGPGQPFLTRCHCQPGSPDSLRSYRCRDAGGAVLRTICACKEASGQARPGGARGRPPFLPGGTGAGAAAVPLACLRACIKLMHWFGSEACSKRIERCEEWQAHKWARLACAARCPPSNAPSTAHGAADRSARHKLPAAISWQASPLP